MPKLFLLCGQPASGKSTMVANLQKAMPRLFVLSADALIEEWGAEADLNYAQSYKAFYADATVEVFHDAYAYFAAGVDVAWDQTNLTPERRHEILSITPPEYEVHAITFEMPEDLLDERLARREAATGKMIPESAIQLMRKTYVRPDFSEDFASISIITPQGLRRLVRPGVDLGFPGMGETNADQAARIAR